MPTYTERPDLPELILRALKDDTYFKELREYRMSLSDHDRELYDRFNMSVTSLTQPPRVRQLLSRYDHLIEMDPMENIFKLYGNVVHILMERYASPGDLVETRLGMMFNGMWIHGKADLIEVSNRRITDYKVTKSRYAGYAHDEYIAQLNVLKYIAQHHSITINDLRNVYLYRDWEERNVKEGSQYPKEPMVEVVCPVWSDEEVEEYLHQRTTMHMEAMSLDDDDLPDCTPDERWVRPAQYLVYKIDPRTKEPMSRRRFMSLVREEAEQFIDATRAEDLAKALAANAAKKRARKPEHEVAQNLPEYILQVRPCVPARCFICKASSWCNQRIKEIEENQGQINDPEEDETNSTE